MKIALIGFGKMGKIIKSCAVERGHTIDATFDSSNPLTVAALKNIDVAIDFTIPKLAIEHIELCLKANVPLVMGTTGWYEHLDQIEQKVKHSEGSFLWASNFSIGVNLFFELNKKLAQLMNPHLQEYQLQMEEIHHTQKLDAPSGTAISLANDIAANTGYSGYTTVENNKESYFNSPPEFPIFARRIPEVPGTHTIEYSSDIDSIKITHEAKNRIGFALGSVIAAEFLQNKTGLFTMKDVLNIPL
ncbi:MAG: 4-hydroxy-tetrahydrodipicolinate reductase [Bacteroidetes bacterium]|nr:4-hydroxy-tetrahydrodipicolinate reductase [Bacteroidota bacterium]